MSFFSFFAVMLVCIYLAIIAQNMKDGAIVWGCSVTLFAILNIKLLIELIKGLIK